MKKQNPTPSAPLPSGQVQAKTLSPDSKRILNALVLQAKSAGLTNGLFMFRNPTSGEPVIHLENMQISDALNFVCTAWNFCLDQDIERSPNYSEARVMANRTAQKEFMELCTRLAERIRNTSQ